MGRTSITGGVTAKGQGRTQFTFRFEGTHYRPTMPILPTEANLRRARQQLERIKRSIANGTFSFAEEFPDFRDLKKVLAEGCPRTCAEGSSFPRSSSLQSGLSSSRKAASKQSGLD
jgi:hypothetical protein